jgi:tetratricopeptide (TPR) repeat protein
VARPHNKKKEIKAGMTVEKKMAEMIQMTKQDDFGELTGEIELLDQLISNMQKAVLEPLLESVETIERRMKAYQSSIHGGNGGGNNNGESSMNQSTSDFGHDPESSRDLQSNERGGGAPDAEGDGSENNGGDEGGGVTAVQQRFLDRLTHFFDFQRIAEERIAIVDPQGKIAAMKVKAHSKGIEEKNGTFKAGYRQQDVRGKPVKHLADLYLAAETAQPEFQTFLYSLLQAVNLTKMELEIAPSKPRARASQKAREEYTYRIPGPAESWLYDILRASIICKSYKQMSDINKYLKENVHIVECENRFASPQFDGYRDILYYVSIPYKDELAFVCEIQLHHKEFKHYFGVNSHKSYFRPYFAGPFRDPVETLRDLDMLLQVGQVDNNLMEFLLEAKDSNQIKLFARIFFEQLEEPAKALELFKRVLTMEESSFGKGHVITGSTYQYLGQVLLRQGDSDGALLYLAEAMKVFSTNLSAENPEVASTLTVIGDANTAKGEYAEALRLQKAALDIREAALGEDHQLTAESYMNVAQSLCDNGEMKKGLAECRTALIIQESILGDSDVELAPTHCMLGKIHFLSGENAKALECLNKALSLQEEVYGKKHQAIADTLTQIGDVKMAEGDLDEAEANHRKALQIREQMLGKGHPDCAISYSKLGLVISRRGSHDEALTILRLALKIRTKVLGKNHMLTASTYADIASVLVDKGDLEGAMAQYKECLTILKGLCGKKHPKVAEINKEIAGIKAKTKQ